MKYMGRRKGGDLEIKGTHGGGTQIYEGSDSNKDAHNIRRCVKVGLR